MGHAKGAGSNPPRSTKISHAAQFGQNKTKPQSTKKKKKSHFGTIQRKTVEKRGLKERGVVFPQDMILFIKTMAVRGKSC